MKFLWPIPQGTRWVSGYDFNPPNHSAQDFGTPNHTPVFAPGDGVVKALRSDVPLNHNDPKLGYGNFVELDLGGGWRFLIAHLATVDVSVGDKVTTGQLIAHTNHTGWSTGPHAHVKLTKNGVPMKPSDHFTDTITPPSPQLPTRKVEVIAHPYLFVRQRPTILAKVVETIVPGTIVDVLEVVTVEGNTWLRIGYKQYIAMTYKGHEYSLWR